MTATQRIAARRHIAAALAARSRPNQIADELRAIGCEVIDGRDILTIEHRGKRLV